MKFVEMHPLFLAGTKVRRKAFVSTEYLVIRDGRAFIKNRNEDAETETSQLSYKAILSDDWQVLVDGEWKDETGSVEIDAILYNYTNNTTTTTTSCCGGCHNDDNPDTEELKHVDNADLNLGLLPLNTEGAAVNITINCDKISIKY